MQTEDETYTIGSELVTFDEKAGPELAGRTQERWHVVKDGRQVAAGIRTKAEAERIRAQMVADARIVPVEFAGGRIIALRADTARWALGLDVDGDVVIEHPDMPGWPYPLTPCCHASGKGWNSPTGVVCRSCYADVDPKYGDRADDVVVPVVRR
jgi:hypothetical protein